MAAGAATRIPSSDDSGFPANGHDGQRPPLRGASLQACESGVGSRRPRFRRSETAAPGRVSSVRGSASLPLKPEAQAEGMRMAAGTATRIPSAYASGFPANGHDGQRPPLQEGHDGQPPPLQGAAETAAASGQDGRVDSSGRRPARQKSHDAMFCQQSASAAPAGMQPLFHGMRPLDSRTRTSKT